MERKISKALQTVDFSGASDLPLNILTLLNETANELIYPFNEFIGTISQKHSDNLDWWVSAPAVRDVHCSNLFFHCCCAIAMKKALRDGFSPDRIVVDSAALKIIMEKLCCEFGSAAQCVSVSPFGKAGVFLISLGNFLAYQLRGFFFAKMFRRTLKKASKNAVTLVDSFVLDDIFAERYYPGLWEALGNDEKASVYFVPQPYGIKKYLSFYRRLFSSGKNYLLKEHFLKIEDYVFAFSYFFRSSKLKIDDYFIDGINVSELAREELNLRKGFNSSTHGLLNYRFVKRLKESKIKIKLFVNWFENQALDKGLNRGLKEYYPETVTKGYQGFINSDAYLNYFPQGYEQLANVLPDEVCVIGEKLKSRVASHCPDIRVSVAPAFRFSGVFNSNRQEKVKSKFTVLVALPIFNSERRQILNMLGSYLKEFGSCEILFNIKCHPATNPEKVKKEFPEVWPEEFTIVGGSFESQISDSDLLITGCSSACMETMARGIPVVIIGNFRGLTFNPVPGDLKTDIYRLVLSCEEFRKAIEAFRNRTEEAKKNHRNTGQWIKENYLAPVTRESARNFLDLEKNFDFKT